MKRDALLLITVLSTMLTLHAACPAADIELQEKFFAKVVQQDADGMIAMMDPALKNDVDEPVLKAWMAGFNKCLGEVRGIKRIGWTKSLEDDGLYEETVCEITCERGVAKSSIVARDKTLVGFNITSDVMKDWFNGPASTQLYKDFGSLFIERFLTASPDESFSMCHPALQELFTLDDYRQMIATVLEQSGEFKESRPIELRYTEDEDAQKLLINYEVVGETKVITCEIKIQFIGLRGHMTGFYFNFE